MAIHVFLDEVMRKRGMTVVGLERRTAITAANLSRLKTGRGRAVRFWTLNAICLALDCQPGDLFEFAPDRLPDRADLGVVRCALDERIATIGTKRTAYMAPDRGQAGDGPKLPRASQVLIGAVSRPLQQR